MFRITKTEQGIVEGLPAADPRITVFKGIPFAAPQVGKLLRLFVLEADDNIKRVFINPQIIATSTETCEYEEGAYQYHAEIHDCHASE